MKTLGILLVALGVLVIAVACSRRKAATSDPEAPPSPSPPPSGKPTAKNGRGTFTIGKATTHVTGPLDENGHIDYAAALNERLSEGVTPENNAAVLIWKALGPNPGGVAVPPGFFEALGMTAPPANSEYFAGHQRMDVNVDALNRFSARPWTASQEPGLSAWLAANQRSLVLVVEATTRTHYFYPYVPPWNEHGRGGLLSFPWPGLFTYREIAGALVARAMFNAGQGNPDAAWQDLLACHRLARLVARGGTLIEMLVGIAIEQLAARAAPSFLEHAKPDAKRLEGYLRELRGFAPLEGPAEKADAGERFMALDGIMLLDRQGFAPLKAHFGKELEPFGLTDASLDRIDWDPALQATNGWHDRIVVAYREGTRAARIRKLDQIENELRGLNTLLVGTAARTLRDPNQPPKAKGQVVGEVLSAFNQPMWRTAQDASDRIGQVRENLIVAFALEWYRRENGRYPKRLGLLAPKYLTQVPQDIFSGGDLIYRPEANGYLLYSVGVNGRDDGGRGPEDNPPGDDQVVRMPVPAK